MKFFLVFSTFVMFFVVSMVGVLADEVKTNVSGLVVKELRCKRDIVYSRYNYSGNVVNRSNNRLRGRLTVHSYDVDGDPIGQCSSGIVLEPRTGDKYIAFSCNCGGAKSVKLIFKERKAERY